MHMFAHPITFASAVLVLLGLSSIGVLLWLGGYLSPSRKAAVPAAFSAQAEVIGFPGIRYTVMEESLVLHDLIDSTRGIEGISENKAHFMPHGENKNKSANFLALSSGADGGAFGAGFLSGWTLSGDRPQFDVVTGISTGGLIAPFAFLGAKYDSDLKSVFTNSSPKQVFAWRNILDSLFDDAVADTLPLSETIKHYITRDVLNEIAGEYERGRLLVVTTTNIDSRRAVLWNMTKIASISANGNPRALELFQKILLAAAAIPGVFPPVMFDVEIGGKRYQEMHVDGAVISQLFVYPSWLVDNGVEQLPDIHRKRRLYLIRNTRREPLVVDVGRQAMDIVNRSVKILLHSQGVSDLYRIYMEATHHGIDYNLAHIPEGFDVPHEEYFSQEYMRKLYAVGFNEAKNGYRWKKHPWLYGETPKSGFGRSSIK